MSRPVLLGSLTALLVAALLTGTARAATTWADTLTARALREGPSSHLPPHLSAVLGLTGGSDTEGLAVRQLVFRDGFSVHTFNVGAAQPHVVVLMVADEAAHRNVAYLVTRRGQLRKAVAYSSGEAPQELEAKAARPGFAAEVRFWSGAAGAPAAPR